MECVLLSVKALKFYSPVLHRRKQFIHWHMDEMLLMSMCMPIYYFFRISSYCSNFKVEKKEKHTSEQKNPPKYVGTQRMGQHIYPPI